MSVKQRIVARINRLPLMDRIVYKAKHGPAAGLRRQGGLGWLPSFMPGMHEASAEINFLEHLAWKGLNVYDVGGDQGLFTLFFAHRVGKVGRVITFEPNPRSRERIRKNIQINGFENVRIMPLGLSMEPGSLEFTFPPSELSRGTAVPAIAANIKNEGGFKTIRIEVNSLDDEIVRSNLPVPHFIKIDVEGMEFPVLCGMRKTLIEHQPRLLIEIHGCLSPEERISNTKKVNRLLEEVNYQARRIESDEVISDENVERIHGGHFFCQPKGLAARSQSIIP